MSLEPLIKNFYNVEQVTRRWQKVHQDYGKDFLQEKIAREEIPAFISLQNCLLFPVSGVNKLYKYLELHITPTKRGKVYVEAIHESNEELIARRLASRKTFYASAWVFADAQLANTTFNKTSPGKYTKTFGNQDLSELFLNEKHLLSSEHSINHHYVESNCRTDIETVESDDHEPIIRVECPIAVTPFAQFDNPFGISFTPPEEMGALSKINLSNLGGELINKLSQASVVLWRGKFYYVVNKNTNTYKDQEYQCLSLSSDVLKSYQRAGGAVIRKKDIEKFEQSFFCQASPSNHINKSSNIFEDLILFNQVIEDFKNSKVYDKYSAFLKHRNKGVTSADAFDVKDIDDWVITKTKPSFTKLGYNITTRSAELIKKMIVKKYSIKKDKRQISKITS